MGIDFQRTPQILRCGRIVAFVHGFSGLFEVGVQLHLLGTRERWRGRRHWPLSRQAMHTQQTHRKDSRDLPGAILHSHAPNSNPLEVSFSPFSWERFTAERGICESPFEPGVPGGRLSAWLPKRRLPQRKSEPTK